MHSYLLTIIACMLCLNIQAQNQSFSSTNIDSLLSAYEAHEEISLPKAYCLDQIIRFYANEKEYAAASNYLEAYKEISSSLKNIDVSNRYTYRQVRLDYLTSEETTLDTIAANKIYTYFRANDSRMCSAISSMMVSYLKGPDGFGESWLENKEQLITWYVRSGEDSYRRKIFIILQCTITMPA
jgi:hypothetical protein